MPLFFFYNIIGDEREKWYTAAVAAAATKTRSFISQFIYLLISLHSPRSVFAVEFWWISVNSEHSILTHSRLGSLHKGHDRIKAKRRGQQNKNHNK